jgi:LCP family protein required for cell wall assembly
MPVIRQPRGTINVLLLGSDRRPGEKIARTDVMLIVSVFPDMPAVSMISVPRDYYAWIPTWGLDKINTAFLRGYKNGYPGGGPGLAKATIEYNFGVPIHYYAMVDFNGYRKIVDAVGGVDIVVECPFHDTYPDAESETGQTDIDLEPGVHHLTGKYALWYARSRWNTSDFDRHRRQQKVLLAIYHAAMTQNLIPRAPELWSAYEDTVETDMGLKTLVYMGTVAMRLDILRDLKSRFIRGSRLIYSMRAPNGGAVLAPHYDALYNFMLEAAQPPPPNRAQRFYRVEVWNGTGNAEWGEVAAERLGLEGFEVIRIRNVDAIRRTTLVDFTTTSKGSPLPKLMNLYQRQKDDVIAEPKEGSDVDFRVVLGWDYNPCAGTKTGRWGGGRSSSSPTATAAPASPGGSEASKGASRGD